MSGYIFIPLFVMFLGAVSLTFQIYKMTAADAESRGLKHPKWWGIFAASGGNNSSGLLLYLLGRKKYPSNMDPEGKKEINSRKNKALVSLLFLAAGAVGAMAFVIF